MLQFHYTLLAENSQQLLFHVSTNFWPNVFVLIFAESGVMMSAESDYSEQLDSTIELSRKVGDTGHGKKNFFDKLKNI